MTFDPGPLDDVALAAEGEQWTLIFLRELRQAPAVLQRPSFAA